MSTRYDAFTYRADGRSHRILTKAKVAAHARPGTAPQLIEVDAEQKSVKYKLLDRFVADGWQVNE